MHDQLMLAVRKVCMVLIAGQLGDTACLEGIVLPAHARREGCLEAAVAHGDQMALLALAAWMAVIAVVLAASGAAVSLSALAAAAFLLRRWICHGEGLA